MKCLGFRPVGSAKTCRSQHAGTHQRQHLEPDQRCLLSELIDGHVAGNEHREAVVAVDRVVPLGIDAQVLRASLRRRRSVAH